MESRELLEKLFDNKKLKILRYFFNNSEEEFYIRELSKKTRIPVATTFRIINKLLELEIIKEHRLKKFKLYSLNQNKNTEFLQDLLTHKKTALNEFVENASTIEEIDNIILHGKEEKNKANVLLIGHNIPIDIVKSFVIEIKEKYDFKIIDLTLEPDQYTKMSDMGLFPGKKTVFFQK